MIQFYKTLVVLLSLLSVSSIYGIGQKIRLSDESPIEREIKNRYRNSSLIGNIKPMRKLITDNESRSPKLKELSDKFRIRFTDRSETFTSSGNKFVDDVLSVFRKYWVSVLMQETDTANANTKLNSQLSLVSKKYGLKVQQNPVRVIRAAFAKRGFYLLTGVTAPYRELMIWKNQTEKTYQVALTDGTQDLTVVALDDFVSNGWLSFASFGINASAGWATRDKLFVVASAYDIGSEGFEVSYLKHEARHLVDNRVYPSLRGFELEHRAKLTELAYADQTSIKLIDKFIVEANKDSTAAHPKANFDLISDLSKIVFEKPYQRKLNEWRKIKSSVIRQAARELLKKNTKKLLNRR